MGRLGYIRPTSAHAIGGTEQPELALLYSFISSSTAGPKHHSVMTTGWTELLEHGRRRSIRRGRSTFRDYGPDGAADRLSRSTPQLADDTSTRPSSSKPTRQSDALDQEPIEACRSYGSGYDVIRPQTLGRKALHGSLGGDCREGNASNSEAEKINGEQGVECQPGQYPDQSWCQP
jgi:hypothetical protein